MAKYLIRRYYTTYLWEEVESESVKDALEQAREKFDNMSDEEYRKTLLDNVQYDYESVEDDKGITYY